ncbi:MAG: hypothetical protein NTY63_00835 [Candidatus Bipolaricaulota bacterium]|nr:hypothetical protein [Candidatus Bipolaricaulota bacterium]
MSRTLAAAVVIVCSVALLPGSFTCPAHAELIEPVGPLLVDPPCLDASEERSTTVAADEAQDLAIIASHIARVSQGTRVRRNIAQATFCLPQNVLGILYYGLLQLTGNVLGTADVNEVRIIVTRTPFGVSLGRFIFVSGPLLTENTVRHEYGHALQGYKQGPFYLPFEGLMSFVQAGISLISRSFADAYFDRWPENEANTLGGVK